MLISGSFSKLGRMSSFSKLATESVEGNAQMIANTFSRIVAVADGSHRALHSRITKEDPVVSDHDIRALEPPMGEPISPLPSSAACITRPHRILIPFALKNLLPACVLMNRTHSLEVGQSRPLELGAHYFHGVVIG
jgi:hypothetical protein